MPPLTPRLKVILSLLVITIILSGAFAYLRYDNNRPRCVTLTPDGQVVKRCDVEGQTLRIRLGEWRSLQAKSSSTESVQNLALLLSSLKSKKKKPTPGQMRFLWALWEPINSEVVEVAKKFVLANCYDPKIACQMFDE